jgi:sulfur-carrier protein
MLHILYFARLRDELNCSEEQLEWQPQFCNLENIKTHLRQRNPHWHTVFNNTVLSAVNQTMANTDQPINDGDEIAFFPPVTGG